MGPTVMTDENCLQNSCVYMHLCMWPQHSQSNHTSLSAWWCLVNLLIYLTNQANIRNELYKSWYWDMSNNIATTKAAHISYVTRCYAIVAHLWTAAIWKQLKIFHLWSTDIPQMLQRCLLPRLHLASAFQCKCREKPNSINNYAAYLK